MPIGNGWSVYDVEYNLKCMCQMVMHEVCVIIVITQILWCGIVEVYIITKLFFSVLTWLSSH